MVSELLPNQFVTGVRFLHAVRSLQIYATIGDMPYKDPSLPENIEKARASRRKHYANNKKAYIDRAKGKTNELRQFVRELKESTPCKDCGVQYRYYTMQFDHLDGSLKVGNVESLTSKGSMQNLLAEIAKCDLVCANCHTERTWKRANGLL